jgi:hypothetical protein
VEYDSQRLYSLVNEHLIEETAHSAILVPQHRAEPAYGRLLAADAARDRAGANVGRGNADHEGTAPRKQSLAGGFSFHMGEPADRRPVPKTGGIQVRLLAPVRSPARLGERACRLITPQR